MNRRSLIRNLLVLPIGALVLRFLPSIKAAPSKRYRWVWSHLEGNELTGMMLWKATGDPVFYDRVSLGSLDGPSQIFVSGALMADPRLVIPPRQIVQVINGRISHVTSPPTNKEICWMFPASIQAVDWLRDNEIEISSRYGVVKRFGFTLSEMEQWESKRKPPSPEEGERHLRRGRSTSPVAQAIHPIVDEGH